MSVTRDINLGTLVPIILFLILQTGGGIWWASSIHSAVATQGEKLEEFQIESDAENLRQWARINSNEDEVAENRSREQRLTVLLERLDRDVTALRSDIRATNQLLRDILIAQAQAGELQVEP